MHPRHWTILATLVLLTSAAPAADYMFSGIPITVTFTPEKAEPLLGEPIYLNMTIENRSDHDLEISEGGNYRNARGRDENFKITATDAKGKAVPGVTLGLSMSGGGLSWKRPLPAHGKITTTFVLPDWVRLSAEGEYHLQLEARAYGGLGDVNLSEDTSIKVLPADAAKLGSMIAEWGKFVTSLKPHDGGPEGVAPLKKLCFIDDERAVPYLAVLAVKPFYQTEAIRALAKFPTVEAVAALKQAGAATRNDMGPESGATVELKDQSAANIRHFVAIALTANTHPNARDALIAMRNDAYDPIRGIALEAMARNPTPADLAALQALTHDPDAKVAKDAATYYEKARTAATRPLP